MVAERPRRIYATERLTRLLGRKDTRQDLRTASIESINADGTVDLRLADGVRRNVQVGSWYSPAVGDSVRVLRADPFSLFVLGTTLKAAPATVTVSNSILLPYNVGTAPVAPPPVGTSSGTAYFDPIQIRSYRSPDGWERAEAYQGAYSSGSYGGYWYGCYFYGQKPQSLKGKTVTSASIRIHRRGTGGGASNVAQYIAPHNHFTQPSGAPYFTAAASRVGYVDWNQALELPLSTFWVQLLVNGGATVRGFGHRYAGTASYSIAHALSTDSHSGRLTIRWKG